MKSYLGYWRNSLADSAKLSPSDDSVDTAIQHKHEIKPAELIDGKLPLELTESLFAHSRARASPEDDDDELKSIPAAVFPIVLARNFSHGERKSSNGLRFCIPLSIPARVSEEGRLCPDDDRKPFLIRHLLAPSSSDETIGDLDDADTFYAEHPEPLGDWETTVGYARKLLENVSDQSFDHLELDGWTKLDHGIISVAESDNFFGGLIAAYDRLIARDKASPLITRLIDGIVDEGKLGKELIAASYADHLGQMTNEFGLAPSQRDALAHILTSQQIAHEVLAINGPPGTGKTTMLQSVIATSWVKAALMNGDDDEVHCPIIVAASSNNQAVTNIIDSFDKKAQNIENPLDGRWIKGVGSYGLFLPSKTADVRNRQIFRDTSDYFAVELESREGLKRAKEHFLECVRLAFYDDPIESLSDGRHLLHRKLRETCSSIKEITQSLAWLLCQTSHEPWSLGSCRKRSAELDALAVEAARAVKELEVSHQSLLSFELAWADYKSNEPLWLVLLSSFPFLKSVRTHRYDRDSSFLLGKKREFGLTWLEGLSRDEVNATLVIKKLTMEELLYDRREASTSASNDAETFKKHLKKLSTLINQGNDDCSLEELLDDIDRRYRYRAFMLATHYWEAKYLLEVESDLMEQYVDKKSGAKRLRHFRRLAKLTPCFVSTVYKLPDYFTGWSGEDQPLWDEIDLLIVDEAGQTGTDIAAPSFAFAKRALVVGDTHQIAPIAKIPRQLDATNVKKFKVGDGDYDEFAESGLAAAEGSLMLAAQQASRFTMVPSFARGLLLREHRRCRDEIIAYCNQLIYQGLLLPSRGSVTNPPDLPPLGYAQVNSEHRRVGRSRDNVVEAETIALWIKDRQLELEEHYEKEIGDVLGIVTPFSPQVFAIVAALERHGLPVKTKKKFGIVVGTTHALQGAERDVILFSPTYGRKHRSGTFFGRDKTLLNVAVSRARDSFLIFGNMHLFGAGAVGVPSKKLGEYVLEPRNELTDIRPVHLTGEGYAEQVLRDLIVDLEKHRATIREAFETAKLEVVIVSPYITMQALESDVIEKQISNVTRLGIRVIIYTDEGLNKNRWADFIRCKEYLERAGAHVIVIRKPGVHSKILWKDDTMLAVGSFNWLSAVRREGSEFQRHETSALFRPPKAAGMIKKIDEELRGMSVLIA